MKTCWQARLTGACFIAIAGACCCPADDVRSFRFSKEIKAVPRTQEELLAVPLDPAVYAATLDNLADVRILDDEGAIVPYLRREQNEMRAQTVRHNWSARDLSLQTLGDQGLEITVALGEHDPQPLGLTIVTPLRDFERRIRVYGLPNKPAAGKAGDQKQAAEKLLVPDARIVDYSQYMDVRRLDVRLPSSDYRRFRIVVEGLTANQESQFLEESQRIRGGKEVDREERVLVARRPFRIEQVDFFNETTQQSVERAVEREYPTEHVDTRVDTDKHRTAIEIQTQREPLTGFRLKTNSRNFSRRATVQILDKEGVHADWRDIGSGTVFRFALRDFSQEELKVSFPEHRSEKYRILIDDRDSPPLEIQQIISLGRVDELVFLTAPGGSYRLVYGDTEARAPDYDTAAVRTALDHGQRPVVAGLDLEIASGKVEPRPRDFTHFLNNPIFLTALVVVLVAGLGWGLYRASRRIENLPPQP
jgi:hypothetical protein